MQSPNVGGSDDFFKGFFLADSHRSLWNERFGGSFIKIWYSVHLQIQPFWLHFETTTDEPIYIFSPVLCECVCQPMKSLELKHFVPKVNDFMGWCFGEQCKPDKPTHTRQDRICLSVHLLKQEVEIKTNSQHRNSLIDASVLVCVEPHRW